MSDDHKLSEPVSERLVKNVMITAFARTAMILATTVILPLCIAAGAWVVNRAVNQADKMTDALQTVSASVQRIEYQIGTQSNSIKDHESRLRLIEASNPIRSRQ